MSDELLMILGAFVFAITTWASLAFGYTVFEGWWRTDADDDRLPEDAPISEAVNRVREAETDR